MARAYWKGKYFLDPLLRQRLNGLPVLYRKNLLLLVEFLDWTFSVYDGHTEKYVHVDANMLGNNLGSYVHTKSFSLISKKKAKKKGKKGGKLIKKPVKTSKTSTKSKSKSKTTSKKK